MKTSIRYNSNEFMKLKSVFKKSWNKNEKKTLTIINSTLGYTKLVCIPCKIVPYFYVRIFETSVLFSLFYIVILYYYKKGERLEQATVESFLKEGVIMKNFDHPHVLKLLGVCVTNHENPMVILPYMSNGDLRSYVKDKKKVCSGNKTWCFRVYFSANGRSVWVFFSKCEYKCQNY